MYNFEGLTSSDFEALSLKYSRDIYPAYKWKATKQNADFNRDIEAFIENDGTWSWGEAKHTKKTFKEVSKSRWDPTILSATLKNNVNEVLLITNGWIPLEYIVRVEHFKSRKKILYINALSLSSWYDKFSSSNDINRFEAKIEKFQENYTPKKDNIVKLFVYDTKIDKLEPCTNLVTDCMYEINIPIFLQEKSDISVNIIGSFNVSEVICKKLTHKYNEEIMQSSLMITTSLENGYSQIIIKGFLSRSENNNLQVVVSSKNKKLASKSFCFSEATQHSNKNSDNAMLFLNSVNLVRQTRKNNIIYLNTIPKDEISADMCINYFEFNDSYIHNAKILCRILVLLLSGADISCYESSTIQSTIQHDFFFF